MNKGLGEWQVKGEGYKVKGGKPKKIKGVGGKVKGGRLTINGFMPFPITHDL